MPRNSKLNKHGHEHRAGQPLSFDITDVDFALNDVVVVWALYQAVPGGIYSVAASGDFTPRTGRWRDVQDNNNSITFTPTTVGVYTLMAIGAVDKRPVSHRTPPARVT